MRFLAWIERVISTGTSAIHWLKIDDINKTARVLWAFTRLSDKKQFTEVKKINYRTQLLNFYLISQQEMIFIKLMDKLSIINSSSGALQSSHL